MRNDRERLECQKGWKHATPRGFALVTVLFLVALLMTVVTGLMFLVGNERSANADYSEQMKAQEIAMAGVNTTIADLRQEMRAGSQVVVSGTDGYEVWLPKSAAAMKLKPISNAPAVFSHLRSSVKFDPASVFSGDYSPPLPVSRASSQSSTATPSQNGRSIPYPAFWDKVNLYAATSASKPASPSWIYVQRSGVSTADLQWNNNLKDKSSTNSAYVLGRYAYQLYDVGGLLDINAAGAPTTVSGTDRLKLEGTLAAIDLTQFGLTAKNINDLIQFRNPSTEAKYVDAITRATSGTTGFMTTQKGNNRFFSRGDLIRFAKNSGFDAALPYLTHFSRDLNAPSWIPSYDATSPYTYRSSAATTGGTNRFFVSVSSTGESQTSYTISGDTVSTTIAAGHPRVCTRFPLTRIDWLRQVKSGSESTSLTTAVLLHFGLNWNSATGRWVYNPGGNLTPASNILTLDAVPAGREPNFFELLKAGILGGSLGIPSSYTTAYQYLATCYHTDIKNGPKTPLQDQIADYQIMKIGACIIDQYCAEATPTAIDFDYAPSMSAAWKQGYRVPATGIKNVPYLYTLTQYATLTSGGVNTQTQHAWLEFELWNPHQQRQTSGPTVAGMQITTGSAPSSAPSAIIQGSWGTDQWGNFHPTSPGLQASGDRYIGISTDAQALSHYLNPTTFQQADSTSTSETQNGLTGDIPGTNPTRRAFDLGLSTFTVGGSGSNYFTIYFFGVGASQTFNQSKYGLPLQLAAQSGSNWIPYQIATLANTMFNGLEHWKWPTNPGLANGSGNACMPLPQTNQVIYESIGLNPIDPRTTRGGWALISPKLQSQNSPSYGDNIYRAATSAAADIDGITRSNDIGTVTPASTAGVSERPIILGRQFHTPGDMGYAFRDQPWKSLDFRSANSADAGLLDIFSVYDDPAITAGRINLNSAPQEVIKSIIAGTTKNEIAGSTFSANDADTIANVFVNVVATTPLFSRADLTTFASNSAITGVITNNRKFEREGAIRALSGVGQTRTINLLLDLVAQTGQYAPNASSMDHFNVTSQHHVWAHIAIDRYSGQVVGLQIEPVYE